jgi:hypothetical protein
MVPGGVPHQPPTPHPSGDKTLAPLPGSSFCIRGLDITTAQDRIMIYGPKADGYLVEFRTAEGEALSIPGTEATVSLRRGQVNAVRAAFKAGIKPSRIARQFGNRNQM